MLLITDSIDLHAGQAVGGGQRPRRATAQLVSSRQPKPRDHPLLGRLCGDDLRIQAKRVQRREHLLLQQAGHAAQPLAGLRVNPLLRLGGNLLLHLAAEFRLPLLVLRAGDAVGELPEQRDAVEIGAHAPQLRLVVHFDLRLSQVDAPQIDLQRLVRRVHRIAVVDERRRAARRGSQRGNPTRDLQRQGHPIGAGRQLHANLSLRRALAVHRQTQHGVVHWGVLGPASGDQPVEQLAADGKPQVRVAVVPLDRQTESAIVLAGRHGQEAALLGEESGVDIQPRLLVAL